MLSSAIEQSKEGIAVIDLNENYMFFNEAYAEIHGFPPNDLKASTVSTTYPHSEHDALKNLFKETRENGFYRGQMLKVRRDGTIFPVSTNCTLLKNDKGEPIAYVSSISDITNEVKAEQEREQLLKTLASKNNELKNKILSLNNTRILYLTT